MSIDGCESSVVGPKAVVFGQQALVGCHLHLIVRSYKMSEPHEYVDWKKSLQVSVGIQATIETSSFS